MTGANWHDSIAGYQVVRTRFGHGKVEDLSPVYGVNSYGLAVERAHRERLNAEKGFYARIDVLYLDGSRGIL